MNGEQVKLVYYKTRSLLFQQRYAWRLIAVNGRELSRSSEGYGQKADAKISARLTIGANRPEIEEIEEW